MIKPGWLRVWFWG